MLRENARNEKFYNFRKLRNVSNSDKKKLVKIGRIADSRSTNIKKTPKKHVKPPIAKKKTVSQKPLWVVVFNLKMEKKTFRNFKPIESGHPWSAKWLKWPKMTSQDSIWLISKVLLNFKTRYRPPKVSKSKDITNRRKFRLCRYC